MLYYLIPFIDVIYGTKRMGYIFLYFLKEKKRNMMHKFPFPYSDIKLS